MEDGSNEGSLARPELPYEVKVATISSASLGLQRGILTAWLTLSYGAGRSQNFGGWVLRSPRAVAGDNLRIAGDLDLTGFFVSRVLDLAGVTDWGKLAGCQVRVKATHEHVAAIGRLAQEDWFWPTRELAVEVANVIQTQRTEAILSDEPRNLGWMVAGDRTT